MKTLSGASLVLILHATFCVPAHLLAATNPAPPQPVTAPAHPTPVWNTAKAEHVYGFPDIKPNRKGTLTLTPDTLTFSAKSGNTSIPRASVTAVSAGNERVEIWGMGGRILRMTIPDGGGVAAAAFMHHRIDMLTVEFTDPRGGAHSAVFFLPANEAGRALQSFDIPAIPTLNTAALTPLAPESICTPSLVDPNSVLVAAPQWDRADVPAAYRSLVYEHVVDRLRRTRDVGHVYREGEVNAGTACPQYTVQISVNAFREGSSVKRAFMGPVGMFVGTTQMTFDATIHDASGKLNASEQIKSTIRGESESTNVADHVAKTLAKRYTTVLKAASKSSQHPTA